MHIRAYRDSDLPLLCQIFLRAVRETASRDYTPGQIAAWAQVDETRWRQKLADSIGLVAVVNSQPFGFITAIGTHIDLLFVSPDRARQGIGGALIEALCVQYPAQILTVDASITAKPCLRLMVLRWWLSNGWRRAGSGLLITGWKNAWR